MRPRFTHDCDKCTFLGHVTINDKSADVWVHKREPLSRSKLIYRHSGEEGDYDCTTCDLVSPIDAFGSVALAMFVDHLGADAASGFYKGAFYKDTGAFDSELVLSIK